MSFHILLQIKLSFLMTDIHHGWHSICNLKQICLTMCIKNTTGKVVDDIVFLENVISELAELIFNRKDVYYNQQAQKLNEPKTSLKTYSSILKTFYNSKKVPLISPLFINNKWEPDFKLTVNFFNKFFADKCTLIQNNSVIPNLNVNVSRWTDLNQSQIIKALDVSKAHVLDDI